ncbi:MAG: sigma-70 family RNA polymerase sigma factor [Planctomycetales bacterium]|nr:sigma-70 family RNA polymerase sigma factor [Planctomycetales bacterium]
MTTPGDDTQRLLERASGGDKASWGHLLNLHAARLNRLIQVRFDRRLQSRLDVDDVLQDVYAEAWRHLPEFQTTGKMPFYLWLRGIARNKLLELQRHHLGTKKRDLRREVTTPRHAASDETSVQLCYLLLDEGTSPSRVVAKKEDHNRLMQVLDSMDELDREVLLLRHYEHLSPTETAVVLGVSSKAAGMRYVRAIRRLRETLASLPGGFPSSAVGRETDAGN